MASVTLRGFILVPDEDMQSVRRELPVHVELTRAEPGCLVFDVTPNENDPNHFDVCEEFDSRAAFEAHQARVESSRWGQVSARVERHYEILE
ncbi:MAG: antibiotic biosynthesis monooxygenase [Deinococcales bacterium]